MYRWRGPDADRNVANADAACGSLTMTSIPGTREVHFRDQDDSGDITPGDTRTPGLGEPSTRKERNGIQLPKVLGRTTK